ncbi:hypothetical protein FB461_0603 [Rarobacter faecitabidus]|uniref:Uncharacterized protein n=1 Tax=Rarobacter faecitabidus TaxID=13243 RepID=A0A542ZV34_RARFA|nr:hypothetical protein FB461_0603 [Rarobacter faecitabidus]
MTTYGIALALGLCLASITLHNIYSPGDLIWRNSRARLILVSQGVLGLVLTAGLLWNPDTEFAAMLFSGWFGGHAIGLGIALWRSRATQTSDIT